MSVPRLLLDTSVLVPAMVAAHEHHRQALPWLERAVAAEFKLIVAAHSLAECFATLTRLPRGLASSPAQAAAVITGNLLRRAKAVIATLDADDYRAVLEDLGMRGIAGGIVYDALIVRAARRNRARIVTFNQRHFARLVSDPVHELVSP
jgi:predicted nucleic acid-binding protein